MLHLIHKEYVGNFSQFTRDELDDLFEKGFERAVQFANKRNKEVTNNDVFLQVELEYPPVSEDDFGEPDVIFAFYYREK